jgi:DNA-binding XRE family transcriptional regulator
MNLAHIIRSWRCHKELTLDEAAQQIGIDRNALHRLERGKAINQAAYARVLGWLLE